MHDCESAVVHKHTASVSSTFIKSVPINCLFSAQVAAATAAQWQLRGKIREIKTIDSLTRGHCPL